MPRAESWLCSSCTQIIQPFEGCTPGSQTFKGFQAAVANNCFICSKIWNLSMQHRQAWDNFTPDAWEPLYFIIQREILEGQLNHIKLSVVFPDPTGEQSEQATDIRFRLIPCSGSEFKYSFVYSEEVQGYTGSSAALDLAYSWFQECASLHMNKCRNIHIPASREGWLPSRLLDIGSDQDTHCKLVITATDITRQSPTPMPTYLTLSYRWGTNPQHALLLSSTIEQHRRGTRISSLPQTFQDFIFVARRFGVRYVWIDCFCIIQDSREDWETEAPAMRHIYANAACNIAASASDSPDGGLFRSRNTQDIEPGIISTTLASESGMPEKFYIFDKSYWDRQLMGGPLHRRGWVFQERFLGPRQLYFGEHQLLWECLKEHKCEGFPRGIPLHDSSKAIDKLFSLSENENENKNKNKTSVDDQKSQGHDEDGMTFDSVNLWSDLVTSYSSCHFTNKEDKLYAFAGIAKLFQEVTGDRYLAGLWQSRLLHMLNWTVFTPLPRGSSKYRAPSWSWASVDGPVKLRKPSAGFEFLATVLDVGVTTKRDRDDTVDITGGFVRLRGPLVKAKYTQQWADSAWLKLQLRDDDPFLLPVDAFPDTAEVQFGSSGIIHFLVLKSQEITYLHDGQVAQHMDTELTCLILDPVSEVDGIYKRIGWFSSRHNKSVQAVLAVCKSHIDDVVIV